MEVEATTIYICPLQAVVRASTPSLEPALLLCHWMAPRGAESSAALETELNRSLFSLAFH